MGLSICFNLTALTLGRDDAKRLVESLHACAQTQGFDNVSQVYHDTDAEPPDDSPGALQPGRRFLDTGRASSKEPPPHEPMTDEEIDAAAHEMIDAFDEKQARAAMGLDPDEDDLPSFSAELIDLSDGRILDVHPKEVFFFWANAEGAEPFIVGLASYPAVIEHTLNGERVRFETGLGVGWHWEGYCKTQYAGMPDAGGPDHFLATHQRIVAVLDHAVSLGIAAEVHDDSGYWDHRDQAALLDKLKQYNAMVASIAGRMKDRGSDIQSPIFDHPAFEHLEADGEKQFERMREERSREERDGGNASPTDD